MFLPQGRDDAENQARYELIDFVLDPMPYGGVNGTLEALDMGVPVVTLVGRRHGERTSFSILANLGVTQTVAQGGREYVDLAVRLAQRSRPSCATCARRSGGLADRRSPTCPATRAIWRPRTRGAAAEGAGRAGGGAGSAGVSARVGRSC